MKVLKSILVSILVLSTLVSASSFEQNGVKEGNNRVSIGLNSIINNDDGEKPTGTFYGEYGKFITDDIELYGYTLTRLNNVKTKNQNYIYHNSHYVTYHIGLGANYYFFKTITLTPYIGARYYYTDSTLDADKKKDGKKVDFSSNSANIHIGLHKFFSEDLAITPEIGSTFLDFTDYMSSYANISLTYFFD